MSQLSFATSVSALKAYGETLNSDARNMASVGAVAGRPFSTLIHFADSTAGVSSVGAHTTRNLSAVGQSIESGVAQNFSITGKGLAVVSDSATGGAMGFTKDGTFSLDKNKNLVNSTGNFLQGWLVNASTGSVDRENVDALAPLSFKGVAQSATATTALNLQTHLNSAAATDGTFKQMVSVYDTAGNVQNLDFTWTKTADASKWSLAVADPTGKATTPTTPISVTFGTDGKPTPATSSLNVTWEGGSAATTSIALNLSGVATMAAPSQALGFDSNGNPPGSFKDVTFDKAGNVMVTFSNGNTVNYARVPLAVFDNMNALQEESPGFFTSTAETGEFTLQAPGSGVAGTIVAGTYEGSTTDGTATYVNLIQNYRNLSGNFKPIEIIQKVYDDIRKL